MNRSFNWAGEDLLGLSVNYFTKIRNSKLAGLYWNGSIVSDQTKFIEDLVTFALLLICIDGWKEHFVKLRHGASSSSNVNSNPFYLPKQHPIPLDIKQRNKEQGEGKVLWHVRVGCVIPFWQFNLLSGEIELSRVDLFLDRLEANKSFFKTELYGLYTSLDRTNSIFSYLNGGL